MLRKFVYLTGGLDFLVGAATWAGALANPQPGQFVALMTLGTFLMMAAACLIWASRNMIERAPVIFWQGLVRLTAACSVLYAVPAGLSESWEYALVAFDGPVALVYLVGIMRLTGASPVDFLLCRDSVSAGNATGAVN
ncbi:MAG: hypothetical protein P8Q97_06055 [Myxococcota bacterium]|jgi:hypothetical protein|nr:hypothetical protein [Myxococcota bacterium]